VYSVPIWAMSSLIPENEVDNGSVTEDDADVGWGLYVDDSNPSTISSEVPITRSRTAGSCQALPEFMVCPMPRFISPWRWRTKVGSYVITLLYGGTGHFKAIGSVPLFLNFAMASIAGISLIFQSGL